MDQFESGADGRADVAEDIAGYRDYLLMLARAALRGHSEARRAPSDVVHQTLLEAHRDRAQCRGSTPGELAAWLRGILANQISGAHRYDTRRRRDVRREIPLWQRVDESSVLLVAALADPGSSPSERADRGEQALRLAGALNHLPEDQREAVELRYLHGWAVRAIAEQMGRSTPAVGGLLHRGLSHLRRLLGARTDPK